MRHLVAFLFLWMLCLAMPAHAADDQAKEKGPKPPKPHEYSYVYDVLDNSIVRPTTRVLDPAILLRRVTGTPREAENVDDQDQVRLPSTWWQPRLGFKPVSVERMMRGPGEGKGPAPGRWKITKAKTQGVTPGFQIKDSQGGRFFIKFDPPGHPDMATAADAIGSYLFWAAGYNVPENTVTHFWPESLDIDPKATYKDPLGNEQPFTPAYLEQLLGKVSKERDGRYRALASRFLPGPPIGPFKYNGRRKDDPEDRIPHEHRRELRGLWTMMAWVNHADCRGPNSLDIWATQDGRSFVRHYLLDFGSILGSSAVGMRAYQTGTEYYLDAQVMMNSLLTLGLKPFAWETTQDPKIPAVGFVESKTFDPVHWKPDFQNPAFDERTVRDIRWGARIVAAFTDDHIRAAIAAGHYTDPRASEYLTHVLIERRDKIVHAWLDPGSQGTMPPP